MAPRTAKHSVYLDDAPKQELDDMRRAAAVRIKHNLTLSLVAAACVRVTGKHARELDAELLAMLGGTS